MPHEVVSGWPYFKLIVDYFALAGFSKFIWISVFFSFFSIIGILSLVLENKRLAILFLSFPTFFVLFFSFQKTMFVRNYLILFLFFSILSARGCFFLLERIDENRIKVFFASLIFIFLITGVR